VIYGANAAGKSNLVKAMKYAQGAILGGERFQPPQPFRFDEKFASQPSFFEFRFLLADRIYIYGFEINPRGIESEWLAVVQGSAEVDIFLRDPSGQVTVQQKARKLFEEVDPKMFSALEALRGLPLKPNQLLINRATTVPADFQGTTLAGIIRWLTQDLVILTVDHRQRDLLTRIESDEYFRSFCKTFLSDVGTGVADLQLSVSDRPAHDWELPLLKRGPRDAESMLMMWGSSAHADVRPDPNPGRVIMRTLVAGHQASSQEPAFLPFAEESDGTQQLLQFMPVIFPSLRATSFLTIPRLACTKS
jgi:hypothetical protein